MNAHLKDSGESARDRIAKVVTAAEIARELLNPGAPMPLPVAPDTGLSHEVAITRSAASAGRGEPAGVADLVEDLASHRERLWDDERHRAFDDILVTRPPDEREERPRITPDR